MKGFSHTSSLLLLLIFAVFSTTSHGKLEYAKRVPNGASFNQIQGIGHVDWIGGGPLNAFGKAFAAAGYKWTLALCKGDADGDGQTNGDELGDPCCVWKEGDEPVINKGLSHPGDPNSFLTPANLSISSAVCRALEVIAANQMKNISIVVENMNKTNVEVNILPQLVKLPSTGVTSNMVTVHYRFSILSIIVSATLVLLSY